MRLKQQYVDMTYSNDVTVDRMMSDDDTSVLTSPFTAEGNF